MLRRVLLVGAVIIFGLSGVDAQWLDIKLPHTPRTPDGKPDLKAAAPRAPDDKPDLSGVWAVVQDVDGGPNQGAVGSGFGGNRHANNLAVDEPGGPPLTVWGWKVYGERRSAAMPTELCLPSGIPPDMLRPQLPFKILQTPSTVVILLEEFNNWRQIHTDGRALPADMQPTFLGYSVGRWDGDTLVVSSAGFNDRTWLDGGGLPHSEELRLTEKIIRPDFGHLNIEFTIDDPKAFAWKWSATVPFVLLPDTELLEHQCENNKWKGEAYAQSAAASETQLCQFTSDFLGAIGSADWTAFRRFWADDAVMVAPTQGDRAPRVEGIAALEATWTMQFALMRQAAGSRGVKNPPFATLQPKALRIDLLSPTIGLVNFYLDGDGRTRRRTLVVASKDGQWKITHLHASDVERPPLTP